MKNSYCCPKKKKEEKEEMNNSAYNLILESRLSFNQAQDVQYIFF